MTKTYILNPNPPEFERFLYASVGKGSGRRGGDSSVSVGASESRSVGGGGRPCQPEPGESCHPPWPVARSRSPWNGTGAGPWRTRLGADPSPSRRSRYHREGRSRFFWCILGDPRGHRHPGTDDTRRVVGVSHLNPSPAPTFLPRSVRRCRIIGSSIFRGYHLPARQAPVGAASRAFDCRATGCLRLDQLCAPPRACARRRRICWLLPRSPDVASPDRKWPPRLLWISPAWRAFCQGVSVRATRLLSLSGRLGS